MVKPCNLDEFPAASRGIWQNFPWKTVGPINYYVHFHLQNNKNIDNVSYFKPFKVKKYSTKFGRCAVELSTLVCAHIYGVCTLICTLLCNISIYITGNIHCTLHTLSKYPYMTKHLYVTKICGIQVHKFYDVTSCYQGLLLQDQDQDSGPNARSQDRDLCLDIKHHHHIKHHILHIVRDCCENIQTAD